MRIIDTISKLFARRPTVSPLYDASPLATTLTVSRVHQILEAARGCDLTDLFTLYRDVLLTHSHIQAQFSTRKLALLGDPIDVQPYDPSNKDDTAAADLIRPILLNAKGRNDAFMHLLDSVLWPVAVAEKIFAPGEDSLRYTLSELRPVPHHLLDFKKGDLRIYDVDEASGRPLSTSQPLDPDRYIVHRAHLLSVSDNHGGPMRAVLFWYLFASLSRDWWARFLDRMGAPFMVGKFRAGDDDARRILQQAFALSTRIGGIAVSDSTQIELLQAGSSTGENYDRFIALCNREISKLLLGQTLSAEAQSTGLGSGVATAHEAVRRDIRRVDGERLGGTLRDQLIVQLMTINGIRGRAPSVVWTEDTSVDAAFAGKLVADLGAAGYDIEEDDLGVLNKKFGFRIRRRPDSVQPFSASQEVGAPHFFAASARKADASLASEALDAVARSGSAPMARALRARYAALPHILRGARGEPEALAAIAAHLTSADPSPSASATLPSLLSTTLNALSVRPTARPFSQPPS